MNVANTTHPAVQGSSAITEYNTVGAARFDRTLKKVASFITLTVYTTF